MSKSIEDAYHELLTQMAEGDDSSGMEIPDNLKLDCLDRLTQKKGNNPKLKNRSEKVEKKSRVLFYLSDSIMLQLRALAFLTGNSLSGLSGRFIEEGIKRMKKEIDLDNEIFDNFIKRSCEVKSS